MSDHLSRKLDALLTGQAHTHSLLHLIIQKENLIMAQDDDLSAAVAALATQAQAAEAAIAAELAKIAGATPDPVVAQAIANIQQITSGLAAAVATTAPPAPAPTP